MNCILWLYAIVNKQHTYIGTPSRYPFSPKRTVPLIRLLVDPPTLSVPILEHCTPILYLIGTPSRSAFSHKSIVPLIRLLVDPPPPHTHSLSYLRGLYPYSSSHWNIFTSIWAVVSLPRDHELTQVVIPPPPHNAAPDLELSQYSTLLLRFTL